MLKGFYTTQMSGKGNVLKNRFEKIISNPWKFSKVITIVCIAGIIVLMTAFGFLLAGFNKEIPIERTNTNYSITITCDDHIVALYNEPFYENGDIYLPLEELFKMIGTMKYMGSSVEYDGDKIHLTYQDEYGDLRQFDMEIGENMITGDNEFMPVTEPFNAPVRHNDVVYVPMEYIHSMWFDDTVIDYRIVADNELIEKLNNAIEFEEEANDGNSIQGYMNRKAYEVYGNWNTLLNDIMAELTESEYEAVNHEAWTKLRATFMENESARYEGGSMQPMIHAYAGAHLTRKRCEQLLIEFIL